MLQSYDDIHVIPKSIESEEEILPFEVKFAIIKENFKEVLRSTNDGVLQRRKNCS